MMGGSTADGPECSCCGGSPCSIPDYDPSIIGEVEPEGKWPESPEGQVPVYLFQRVHPIEGGGSLMTSLNKRA